MARKKRTIWFKFIRLLLNKKSFTRIHDKVIYKLKQEIEHRLVNYNPNGNDENSNDNENQTREEYDVETIKLESAKAFKAYGGIKVLEKFKYPY